MNCEWVEEHLSAYHDQHLEPAQAEQVRVHLITCPKCQAILADYTRFDRLVKALPRVAPRPELRARIFSSPEFHEILQERAGVPAPKTKTPSRTLPPLPPAARNPVRVTRALIGAAVIMLLLASAGAVLHSFAAKPAPACSAPTAGSHLVTSGGDGNLAADGQRLVCDTGVQVGTAPVASPDGQWLAFAEPSASGSRDIYVVRANGSGGHTFQRLSPPTPLDQPISLSWSQDGQTLLVVAHDATDGYTLFAGSPVGTGASVPNTFVGTAPNLIGPIWSPDNRAVAFGAAPAASTPTATAHVGFTVITAAGPGTPTWTTATAGNTFVAEGPIAALGWTSGSQIMLTYAITHDGAIAAIVTTSLDARVPSPPAYAPKGAHIVAAAFDSATNNWAIALNDGTLLALNPLTGHTTPLTHIDALSDSSKLLFSPDGQHLLLTSGSNLWLVTSGNSVLLSNAVGAFVAWRPDSNAIAFTKDSTVQIVPTSGNAAPISITAGTVQGLVWSPNGQRLAIWTSTNVLNVDATGTVKATLAASSSPPFWISVP